MGITRSVSLPTKMRNRGAEQWKLKWCLLLGVLGKTKVKDIGGETQVILKCKSLHIWKKFGPGMEAWDRNQDSVLLKRSLTLREVFKSFKTNWPIRASSRSACQVRRRALPEPCRRVSLGS